MRKKIIGPSALAILLGCASSSVPSEQLAKEEGSVRAAEEMGAAKIPEASLELQLAKDQTAKAKELFKNGDTAAGSRMLMRAQADAELALALAKEAPMQDQARQAMEQLKAMENSH